MVWLGSGGVGFWLGVGSVFVGVVVVVVLLVDVFFGFG